MFASVARMGDNSVIGLAICVGIEGVFMLNEVMILSNEGDRATTLSLKKYPTWTLHSCLCSNSSLAFSRSFSNQITKGMFIMAKIITITQLYSPCVISIPHECFSDVKLLLQLSGKS